MAKKDNLKDTLGVFMSNKTKQKFNLEMGDPEAAIETQVQKSSTPFRATFVCDPTLIKKLKYIGVMSGRLHKDVVAEALSNYISAWEREHGEIVIPDVQ